MFNSLSKRSWEYSCQFVSTLILSWTNAPVAKLWKLGWWSSPKNPRCVYSEDENHLRFSTTRTVVVVVISGAYTGFVEPGISVTAWMQAKITIYLDFHFSRKNLKTGPRRTLGASTWRKWSECPEAFVKEALGETIHSHNKSIIQSGTLWGWTLRALGETIHSHNKSIIKSWTLWSWT